MVINNLSRPARAPSNALRRTPIAAAVGLAIAAGALPAHAAVPEPGAALGARFRVNTQTVFPQAGPAVALDAAGDFVVAWTDYSERDGDDYGIFARRYHADGTPDGAEFQVNTHTDDEQENPAVAMDAAGNFVVVWESLGQDGEYSGVFAQRYHADGTPDGVEFQVNTYTDDEQENPAVAMDAAGDFVIVWKSDGQDGDDDGVFAQRFQADGTPDGAEFKVNTYTADDQEDPVVAMDAAGDLVVAWESYGQDGEGTGVYAQRYHADGTPDGVEFQVNTYTDDEQENPAVAMDAAGDLVVAWESFDQDGDKYGIFARRYQADGAAGSEFQVNTYTSDDQSSPDVAMDALGDFVVVWGGYGQDDGYGLYARRFAADGTAVGADFMVQDTDGVNPMAAMDAAGDTVVVWDNYRSSYGTGDYGIWARRYARLSPLDLDGTLALAPDDAVQHGGSLTLTAAAGNLEEPVTPTGITAIDTVLTNAFGVTAALTIPDGYTVAKTTGTNWTCPAAPAGGVLACTYGAGLPAATQTPNLTVNLVAPQTSGEKAEFINAVFGDQPDAKPDNNTPSADATTKDAAPVAKADTLNVNGSAAGIGQLQATDADKDALTYAIVKQPAHGDIIAHPDGSYLYVADHGYSGADSFTFKANDGVFDSDPAKISITVASRDRADSGGTAGGVATDTDDGGGGGLGFAGLLALGLSFVGRRRFGRGARRSHHFEGDRP